MHKNLVALLLFLLLPLPALAETGTTPSGAARDTLIAVVPADLPPTYFKDPATGKAVGYAIDAMNEVARMAGFKVEYIFAKPWDEMIDTLRSGQADVIPHLTLSPERQKLIDFTVPIEVVPVGLIVTADSKVTGFVPGLKVGTLKGAVPEKMMRKDHPEVQIALFEDMSEVLFALLAGHIDASFVLNPVLMKLAYEAGVEDKLKVISPPVFEAKRGLAVRKGSAELLARLDASVKKFIATPEYASLFTKWYGKPQPYWTVTRTASAMGGVLLCMFIMLLYWRYHSIAKLNREASATTDALQATLDAVNDALFIHDLATGAILDVNRRMCEMYGYAHDEALTLAVEALSSGKPPYGREDAIGWIQKAAAGEPQLFVWHARKKDGTLFWVEVNMRKTTIGGQDRVIVAVRDITERKLAQEKLLHTHSLMQYIISHAQTAIAVHDRNMNYLYVSEQYLNQYGVKERDVLGRNHYEVFPDLPQKWRDVHQRVLAGGAVERSDEDPYERMDGTLEWTRWECRPWYEADGSIGGLIIYTEVITEWKRREDEVRRLNEELERKVRDRTAEFEAKNSELQRVNKLFIGRELRMAELKKRIEELEGKSEEG